MIKTPEVYWSATQARSYSGKYMVFLQILLRMKIFEKVPYRTRMMRETISYVSVIENTLKEVWRNLSRYFGTSQSHFSREGNDLDLSGLCYGLQYESKKLHLLFYFKKAKDNTSY